MLFLPIDIKAAQQTNRLGDEEIAGNLTYYDEMIGSCSRNLGDVSGI